MLVLAAALALAWSALLATRGGFDAELFGVSVTSNDARRPLLLSLLLLVAWAFLNSRDEWTVRFHRTRRATLTVARLPSRVPPWMPAGVAALGTVVLGLVLGAGAVGGSDSYGYASEAELWLRGDLVVEQPWVADVPWPWARWTFSPLGYRPSEFDPVVIVPSYPAGLPLLMALAKTVGGQPAMFWIGPLSAGVLVLATFGIGRRTSSDGVGALAAWLVATSPAVLYMLMLPMSDVPAAAAWAVAFWALARRTAGSALASGLVISAAILLRPNLTPLVVVPIATFLFDLVARRDPQHIWWRVAAFVGGLVPGALANGVINWSLYGSPVASGYGDLSALFVLDHVRPNIHAYLSAFVDTQTVLPLAGIVALLIPAKRLWPAAQDRALVWLFGIFVTGLWALYLPYILIDAWWYLRFLLPAFPLIMVGFSQLISRFTQVLKPGIRAAVLVAIVGAFAIRGLDVAAERVAFTIGTTEVAYADAARMVADNTEPDAVILATLHSGSVRYYGGRLTLRYEFLEPEWFEPAIAWLRDRGAHAYLLLGESEVEDFRRRYADSGGPDLLETTPVAVYEGHGRIVLFDLWEPATGTVVVGRSTGGSRYPRPAPEPFPRLGR